MKKTIYALIPFLLLFTFDNNKTYAQAKINAYFNHPVNTSLATFGINAGYLPSGSMADTIAAYISRAKHSIDIAQYDYEWGGSANIIATAVDTAYAHGITVRWVFDSSSYNNALPYLSSGIHKVGRPINSDGDIMHNKFMIIDANDGNPNDAILCTGSEDWSNTMFYYDYNNMLFIQDSALANVYTQEFNIMFGSSTAVPNYANAKFGTAKGGVSANIFTIAGHEIELYFSPHDNPNTHIASTILTANKDLYIGVYDMTQTVDADNIITAKNNGAYTLAVVDEYTPTTSSAVNSTLSSGLGSNYVVYNNPDYYYHNKMMVVDPSDTCSDPIVETGSENWTSAGTNYNDENILIIHNDTLANIYYQAIIEDFTTIGGGSFTKFSGPCGDISSTTIVPTIATTGNTVDIYPNPASHQFAISYALASVATSNIVICNAVGQTVAVLANNELQAEGTHNYQFSISEPGIYFIAFTIGDEKFVRKVAITGL